VRKALEDGVKKWAQGALITETRDGDAIMIVHDDPVVLAQMARQIMDDVYQAPGQPLMRMALHFGDVQTRAGADETERVVAGGSAILLAARVEPHVSPGQIWATDEFRQQLAQKPSLWRTTPVPGPSGDRFNVKKEGGTEPDLWVKLYRLEL
jgi:class 3 adenylate cyclase